MTRWTSSVRQVVKHMCVYMYIVSNSYAYICIYIYM